MKRIGAVYIALVLICNVGFAVGRTFYVSSSFGDDRNDGLSPQSAWKSLNKVNSAKLLPGDRVSFKRGDFWRGQLIPQSGDEDAPIVYGTYGEGEKPLFLGSVSRDDPNQWERIGNNLWATAKPTFTELEPLSDFAASPWTVHFEGGAKVSFTVLKNNAQPMVRIECTQNGTAPNHIQLYNRRLSIRAGDYFEFSFRIRCTKPFILSRIALMKEASPWISYSTSPTIKVEVSQDGIEFWGNAHNNIVEGCHIWEVYDAALTNQNNAPNVRQFNIYRHNVIWNCEYSFEYWNRPESSETFNIRFEHNTCVNAGYGWGHSQRPDPNGRHLMFYFNSALTSDFYVRYNIFYNATDSCLRMQNDWRKGLVMDYNCWYQPKGVLAWLEFLKLRFTCEQFEGYQRQTGFDAHSIFADPKFVDIGKLDFRLAEDSPARRLSHDGIPAGASKRLTE